MRNGDAQLLADEMQRSTVLGAVLREIFHFVRETALDPSVVLVSYEHWRELRHDPALAFEFETDNAPGLNIAGAEIIPAATKRSPLALYARP